MARTCAVCNGKMPAGKRSDAITCSDVCRSTRSRYKSRMARRVGESLDTAYDLAVETQDGQFPRLAEEELDFLIKYFQGVHADALMHQSPRKWWEEGTS